MMNMLIQIDEERIIRERKYKLEDVWRVLNARFDKYECIKERQEDGSMLYKGNPEKDYFTCIDIGSSVRRNVLIYILRRFRQKSQQGI